ncbi:MAG: TPM domain-containing protein, partial [Candidatus Omnitrophica bacterium]|nr:TPM domain-containing protein [Candidatus Omnitrophota bacterium]
MPKLRPSPKFNFKKPVFLLGLALLAAGSAFALSVPARPSGFVHDAAGLLSESARVKIERTLEDFERETSNQVVVAIFPGLEGESLEDFS